jgi:ADP-ribose pyrophosphatase YjhB (NUDIX family)
VREVREETGLAVRVVRALGIVRVESGEHAYDIHEFLCATLDPCAPLHPGDDAAEARWAEPEDLVPLGVREQARTVIELARNQGRV